MNGDCVLKRSCFVKLWLGYYYGNDSYYEICSGYAFCSDQMCLSMLYIIFDLTNSNVFLLSQCFIDVPSDAPSDVPSDQPSSVPSSMPSDIPSGE